MKKSARYATLIFIKAPKAIVPFRVHKNDRSAFKTANHIREELGINRRTIAKHPHDCENGRHYFIFDGHTHCQFCGCDFIYGEVMRAKPDYQTVKGVMRTSIWNDEWLHTALDRVAQAELPKINRQKVKSRLIKSVGTCPADDGRQTPYCGNAIYYAQHGLGCCCRKCLEKFYGISKEKTLSEDELEYFTDLVMSFVKEKAEK